MPVYGCGQTHLMEGRSGDSDSLGELSLQDRRCCPPILLEPPLTASEGHTFPLQAFSLEVLGQFPRQGMHRPPSEPLCLLSPLGHLNWEVWRWYTKEVLSNAIYSSLKILSLVIVEAFWEKWVY